MGRPSRNSARATLQLDAHRAAVGVGDGLDLELRIAEEVVDQRTKGMQAVGWPVEHMFVRLRRPSDGMRR